VKTILGRLSDLGVKELFKLLTSAGAVGSLEIESAGARAVLEVRRGFIAGAPTVALVRGLATRAGTFCFRPGPVADDAEWIGLEEYCARLDDVCSRAEPTADQPGAGATEGAPADPLVELRLSLAEVPLPGVGPRILIVTADPRPYRVVEPDWRQRGWDISVRHEVAWAEGYNATAAIVHLPASATLAGQGALWLDLVRRAAAQSPPVPVIWVGGLADPWLRHEAIHAGAEFLLPAPVAELGETARWFREDLTAVLERLLARRESGVQREAAAFRDFFLALHADATPAESRASLLRIAGNFFARAALLAVRDGCFESLGGFGLVAGPPARVPRGTQALERVVVDRRPVKSEDMAPGELQEIAVPFKLDPAAGSAELFPLLRDGECLAVLIGHEPLPDVLETASLTSLLARSGSLLGL
jgi:hypothetical protein